MICRPLVSPPAWWTLCAAFAQRPGAAALWTSEPGGTSYLASDPVEVSNELDPEPTLRLELTGDAHDSVPRWIGLVPYEAVRGVERPGWSPLPDLRPAPHVQHPVWHRYEALLAYRQGGVWLLAESPAHLERLERQVRQTSPAIELPRVRALPQEDLRLHGARVGRAIQLMRDGDLYQVNLCRRIDFELRGDAFSLLRGLLLRAPARYCLAWQDQVGVAATSPELLLRVDPDGTLCTLPIKGTRRRGRDAADDARQVEALDRDPKERAELTMVIDVERNDLSRIAQAGSVCLGSGPEVVAHPTLLHRQAEVRALLRPGVSRATILRTMLPSGSVTGAPKSRAMELIAELEPTRRGLYTGGFGVVRRHGGLELAMAIRLATIRDHTGHFHVGGGIVVGSQPEREVAETELKAIQLLGLFEG